MGSRSGLRGSEFRVLAGDGVASILTKVIGFKGHGRFGEQMNRRTDDSLIWRSVTLEIEQRRRKHCMALVRLPGLSIEIDIGIGSGIGSCVPRS